MNEQAKLKVTGHILITDVESGEVILDTMNAIHFENMSLALAQSLAHKTPGPIKSMLFGNGGSTVSGIGTVTYLQPNTLGASASLYNQTYEKIVDDQNINNPNPAANRLEVSHVNGNLFSDIIINCLLDFGEPSGQNASDNATSVEEDFVFDEIGIENYDGRLLTHAIFSPVEKALNRAFSIVYTIRIQLI